VGDRREALLSTGAAAERIGVPVSTLQAWDRLGLVTPPIRVIGRDIRVWPEGDLPALARVAADQKAKQANRRRPELAAA